MTAIAPDRGRDDRRGIVDRQPGGLLILTFVCMYSLLVLTPLVPGVDPRIGAPLVTILFTFGALAAASLAGRLDMSVWEQLAATVLGVGNWFMYALLGVTGPLARLVLVPAADLFLVLAMIVGGLLLSRIIRERTLIVPVAIVLALADVFTVYLGGPTEQALEKMPEVVEAVSVKLPAMGSAAGPEGLAGLRHIATLGPGDTFFAALFFATVLRFGLNMSRTFWSLFAITAGVLGLVVAIPGMPAIPVLPLMAGGFLAVNWREVTLSKREWTYFAIALAIVFVLFAVLRYLAQTVL